ncbi:MAG TPA: DNA primase [Clostridiales bacterium]|nr:DNA primase [Clostridiales bacterium]
MAFSDDFIYQLQLGNPIDDVMKSYVNLIRRGHNFVCSCPFHSEKTPSCTVYPDTQSFYCFGCAAGGDVITFIRKIENLEYIEAIKLLAERAGLDIPTDKQGEQTARIKARILEINRETAVFFYKSLTSDSSKTGLKYFASRGLSPQTIKKYGLGYADNSWDKLKNHLLSLNFKEDELVTAGVCLSKNGNTFDLFRNRAMFPIMDLRGNIIGFGGRILDDGMPKYINTADTPVFKKSRNLFSLNFAKNSSSNRLILAEGYMDVIAINQAGFENVVATLGTSLTSEQSRLISQYAKEVIISYDSDGAGQKATSRAINLLGEAGVTTRIINMEGAKDPDEYIKKFGATRFKLLLDNSDGAINFELEKCKDGLDLSTEVGKVECLKRTVKVLSQIYNQLERDVYISKVSKNYEVSLDVLKAQIDNEITKIYKKDKKSSWKSIVSKSRFRDDINPEIAQYPKESKAEEGIIAYLFQHPDMVKKVLDCITPEHFVTSFNKKIFMILCEKLNSSTNFTLSLLSDEFSDSEMGRITGIEAKHRDILLTEQVVDDYIKILIDFNKNKLLDNVDSNEDLLELQERLKNTK